MPYGFLRIPAGSGNPTPASAAQIEKNARDAIAKVGGAEFVAIYFAVGSQTAVVVAKDLDDYGAAKAVATALHATSYEKFLGTADADKAIDQGRRLLPARRASAPRKKPT
jgi:hypothetical protein